MSPLEKFVACLLRHAPDSAADEIADVLWLAAHAKASSPSGLDSASHKSSENPAQKSRSATATKTPEESSSPQSPSNATEPSREKIDDDTDGGADGSAEIKTSQGRSSSHPDFHTPPATHSLPLRVPSGRALPEPIALVRALRPLTRRVPSRIRQHLAEAATAERVADTGLWQPVLAPERARWLELALVLDTHASMAVWQPTLSELRKLLETLGAFRDVRLWTLDTSRPGRPPLLHSAHSDTLRPAKELVSPNGRRLILLATDCLGPAWRDGSVATWLQSLAARQPVVLWQLLPEHLWRQTHLRHAQFVHVSAAAAGAPNTRLRSTLWRAQPDEQTAPGAPIPIVNAEPRRLAAWARFLAGAPRLHLPAVILRTAPTSPVLNRLAARNQPAPASPSAEQRVLAFRRSASPEACRLACLLAASVLRFPVMRLVQAAMLPGTGQTTLAEVFLGGLLVRADPAAAGENPDEVDYDFHPGVRELLLRSAWTPEVLQTHYIVSDYLMRHLGLPLDFRAMVAAPATAPTEVPEESRSRAFASVTAAVLRRLGGDYAALADRLDLSGKSSFSVPSPARFAGIRILWVDDKPAGNQRFHKELSGAEIIEAKSTVEALLLLTDKEIHFDAVISDLGRPEDKQAGLTLLRELRERGQLIPFAIFSRFVSAPVSAESFRLGAFACTASFKRLALRLARQIGTDDRYILPEHINKATSETLDRLDLPRHVSHVLSRDPGSEAWQVFWGAIAKDPIFARVSTFLVAIADCDTLKAWSHRVGQADFVAAIPSYVDAVSAAKPEDLVIETAQQMRSRILRKGNDFVHDCALIPAINRSGPSPVAAGVLEFHFRARNTFSSTQHTWLSTFLERLPPLGRRLLFTPPDEKPLAWVLVAGAEKWRKEPDLAKWAKEVGAALADARFGLICGGWPGVEEVVIDAYLKVLEHRAADPARFVRQIIRPYHKPRIKVAETIITSSIPQSITRCIEAADAVVMIGGVGGTARVGREALTAGLPVLPLPYTGGDALKFYSQLNNEHPHRKKHPPLPLGTLAALYVPLKKLRQPLIDLIRERQNTAEAKERIEQLKEGVVKALNYHDLEHLHEALNDTDPGHYGVDDVEFSVALEDLDLDRALRRFSFRGAQLSFTARLGSSREEDSIDLPSIKEVSGSGAYELGPKGSVSVTAFKITASLNLFEEDDDQHGNGADTI
ncbi:response regulator with CheY-like receiver, AAA-type ATPase, and DNA-binding domains [Opitutaceae bacterium TAV1]|nr:response regulator with CheY-like receiver, AAA-type ATPase, and DNA-binding domains [Opitutaceae bacterium TAV1]